MKFKYGVLEPNTKNEISSAVSLFVSDIGPCHLKFCLSNDDLLNTEDSLIVEGDFPVLMGLSQELVKDNINLIMYKNLSLTDNYSFNHFVIQPIQDTEESQENV